MERNYDAMKNSLMAQVCAVLDGHELIYDKQWVEKNLDCYSKNKAALLDLLRKHPKWDEDLLAVVFEAGVVRNSSETEIEQLRLGLEEIALEIFEKPKFKATGKTAASFQEALKLLCSIGRYIDDAAVIRKLSRIANIPCRVDDRTSRVVDRLCKAYLVDSHKNYNSVFTALADALNPLFLEHKAVLSLHPCDFLKMFVVDKIGTNSDSEAYNGNGRNTEGTLAFLNDEVSMVFYTVDADAKPPYYNASRINSEIYCYENGVLLQSRLQRNNSSTLQTLFRNIVQQVFAECLDEVNLWRLSKDLHIIRQLYRTFHVVPRYNDFIYSDFSAKVSLLKSRFPKGMPNIPKRLTVGQEAYCLNCGEAVSGVSTVYCDSCGN